MPSRRKQPHRSNAQTAFLRDVATKLTAHIALTKKRKIDAARELGISKQRLHKYLKGEMMPGSDFLCQVARKWNLEFEYRRVKFGAAAFEAVLPVAKGQADQLVLFDTQQVLSNEKWEVRVHRRRPGHVDLSIEIKIVS